MLYLHPILWQLSKVLSEVFYQYSKVITPFSFRDLRITVLTHLSKTHGVPLMDYFGI